MRVLSSRIGLSGSVNGTSDLEYVMNKQVWLLTGAGRGMGADFARAALASGYSVVASGRDRERVSRVLGTASDLLALTLDVTSAADAEAAVRAAVDRFGRIDVLVNNAASCFAGYFEELTAEQIGKQLAASLIGPMNVTRAVLPVMRKQRSGHIISISSSAGLAAGFEFVSAYAASKFGLEGWMESLRAEVAPFGITTTIVNHNRRAASSPAPMPLQRQSRRSPISRRRLRRTTHSRRHSLLTEALSRQTQTPMASFFCARA